MTTPGEGEDRLEPILVPIDPDIAHLIPGFLENQRQELEQMQKSVEAGDLPTVRRLGHSMKGAGGGYGFDGVSAIGGEIEFAARVGDVAAIQRWLEELESYLQRVQPVEEQV